MRVLHLSNTPISGAPYKLMQVQKLGGIDARLISHTASYDRRNIMVFPYDILLQNDKTNKDKRQHRFSFRKDEVFELFKNADILHFHNYLVDQFVFKLFPELTSFLKEKLVVIQFHSPRLSLKNVEKNLKHKDVDRRFVVAQYQVRQFPEATPVPNAIPINDGYYTPVCRNNCPPIIAYSPSNTNLRDWNNKGFTKTMSTFKRLSKISQALVITNTPNTECLKKKQIADIAIDEVVTGSYHLNTLEALSQGQVAICGMDKKCEEALSCYTGTTRHPIVIANPQNLQSVLEHYLYNPEELKKKQIESRKFMETHWSSEQINNFFNKLYRG